MIKPANDMAENVNRVGIIPTLNADVHVVAYPTSSEAERTAAIEDVRESMKKLVRSLARQQAWVDHCAIMKVEK